MPRTKTLPIPIPPGAPADLVRLLTEAAVKSVQQTDDIVAMLETLRRTSPRDYIAAMVMIARLNQEVPTHAPNFTVISAIPRSKLDELPAHMAREQNGTTVN